MVRKDGISSPQHLLFQSFIAITLYCVIIVLTSSILEFDPSQPVAGLNVSVDRALTICILTWNNESLKNRWPLGFSEAPIFFPNKHVRFYSEHLFGHLVYAYPLSFWIKSPLWIFHVTYQLNRLTIALAVFLLCLFLTSSFLPSLIAGAFLLIGWHFGQIPNTGLGWAIFTMLFFIKNLESPKWGTAILTAVFASIAALCSGYLAFFTPIVLLILLVSWAINHRTLPSRLWWIQMAAVLAFLILTLTPTMLMYKTVQREAGLVRGDYKVSRLVFPSWKTLDNNSDDDSDEANENPRTLTLSHIATLQILLLAPGLLLILRKKLDFDGWQYGFLLLLFLSFWMASIHTSPYLLLRKLPGYDGLRAVFRWYFFFAVALTVFNAMTLTYLVNRKPRLIQPILALLLLTGIAFSGMKEQKAPRKVRQGNFVYGFLNQLPEGPVCILPIPDTNKARRLRINGMRMLYQLDYRFPMISGHSGFTPPLTTLIESTILEEGISPGVINKLMRTGVRYLVIDSMIGDTDLLRKRLRSLKEVKILYDDKKEMVVELPAGPVEKDIESLLKLWES